MSFCKHCGNKLADGVRFCSVCGKEVAPGTVPQREQEPQVPVCPNCKTPVPAEAKFCKICGTKLHADGQEIGRAHV